MPKTPDIILALDFPNQQQTFQFLDNIGDSVSHVKVGLELFTAEGPAFLHALQKRSYRIFLDLKLHDIPHTIANTIESLDTHTLSFLTLHALGGASMLQTASETAQQCLPETQLLAVTVLTSLNASLLAQLNILKSPQEQTLDLACLALQNGMNGIVCSPRDVFFLRQHLGRDPIIATPGIRSQDDQQDDQQRTLTAREAQKAGTDFLIIGRPITQATCPLSAIANLRAQLS